MQAIFNIQVSGMMQVYECDDKNQFLRKQLRAEVFLWFNITKK